MKHLNKMFFMVALVMLVIGLSSAVSAVDDTVTDSVISETQADTTVEPVTTTCGDTTLKNTKQIEKATKENVKTATKTVEVNDYNELTTAINSAVTDSENDEYVINLNNGTYQITANTNLNSGTYTPNITINANNQTLSSQSTRYTQFNNGCNVTINDAIITQRIQNNGNKIILNNVIINNTFTNKMELIIKNSTVNTTISNSGTLTLADDVIIGENFGLSGNGQIITNDDKFIPYLPVYEGDVLLENLNLSVKTNNGNLTIINCTTKGTITNNGDLTIENSTVNGIITNKGKLTIRNSTITQRITNSGTLILDDNIEFGANFQITGTGHVITDNMSKVFPYMNQFYEEATVILGEYNKEIMNYGKLTIENSTLTGFVVNREATSEMTLKNTTINSQQITNIGRMELNNATVNSQVNNNGILIISDDTVLGENFNVPPTSSGQIIINDTQRVADFLSTYTGNIVLNNKTISTEKDNQENLTLNNCTINATITNNGRITIDDNTVFADNGKITGKGEIITDNINRLLPYIDCIHGNYTITDTTLNKTYSFDGNVTLNNCTITKPDNTNYGILNLNKCTVNVGEDNIFLDNLGTVYVRSDTSIIGQIENIEGQTIYQEVYEPKTIVVTNRTLKYYFDIDNGGNLTSRVNPGDTLDFQGAISGIPNLKNLCVNKPVNIISTTQDAVIDLNTTNGDLSGQSPGNLFAIVKEGAYTNVTGIYFHNTQLWLYNTDHVTLDNISAVVEDQKVGNGVGQTSIRANSTYITVKNSYFYTRNNGGSSTLVIAWGNYCSLINNTVVGEGNVGNLIYLTTYNVGVPRNVTYNSHNLILNNTLHGPKQKADICWGIVLSGTDNLVDGNIIDFNGAGVNFQWGSGSDTGEGELLYNITGNTISNNKLYRSCGIYAGDIIYNNYVENGTIGVTNAIAYNNTASSMTIDGQSQLSDNTINGDVLFTKNTKNTLLENNIINGNINLPTGVSNVTFTQNNITGSITLDGSNNIFTNNRIISEDEYTIYSRRACINNVITDNYLLSAETAGDDSVYLKHESNIIENNLPINTKIEVIAASEVTVNTTTPVIIIVTRKDQLTTEDITITVNNENETVTAKNGIIVYQYTPNTVGDQEITATFAGYGDYITSTSTATIKVTPDKDAIIEELNNTVQQASKDCVLTIDNIPDIKFNDNLTIYGKLMNTKGTGIAGEKVTVNVNGVDNTVTTDANGVWKLKVKTTTLGTNNVTATYTGTQYNPFTTSTRFQIAQTEAIITIDKIVTTQFRDNVTITGTFKNSNGKAIANSKVRVNVNGYSTYITTDHDGVWSLTLKTNKTGVNNVTASFTGNANYAKYTANATFNVTKQDLVITTEVKYNKGNFTITGTFVDKNGNKLANSKIRVNINGKAVYVKTDSNGTYTYSELVTAKTIKYNVYYGGSANYNSYTSSKTTLTVA